MQGRLQGVIEAVEAERPGVQEVRVRTESGEQSASDGSARRALNFIALNGRVHPGDRVCLNTVAVEMQLGTGGYDFVISSDPQPPLDPPAGHILKLRYTPLQTPVLAVEAPESPYHDAMRLFAGLDDLPVVCAELHSQVPAICAAARWALSACDYPRLGRIAYVMTEGAALPMALSRLVPAMRRCGLLDVTITAGQAFGGDLEAVNIYSALAAAKEVAGADIIVVAQGPGNVGTDTPLGFSGIDQGIAVNATASLGGVPIVAARISFMDPRTRHRGLSHHTVTTLCTVARAHALVPLPRLPEVQQLELARVLQEHRIEETHQVITVDAERGLEALIASGLPVTTMGRTLEEERPFFLAAAAAGLLAAQLAEIRLLNQKAREESG